MYRTGNEGHNTEKPVNTETISLLYIPAWLDLGLTCSTEYERFIRQLPTVSYDHHFVHSALQQVLEREALDLWVNLSSLLKRSVWVVQKDIVPVELPF